VFFKDLSSNNISRKITKEKYGKSINYYPKIKLYKLLSEKIKLYKLLSEKLNYINYKFSK